MIPEGNPNVGVPGHACDNASCHHSKNLIYHAYIYHLYAYIYVCVRIEATHLCLALGALLGATGARSVAATYKPPMLVPRAQLPARACLRHSPQQSGSLLMHMRTAPARQRASVPARQRASVRACERASEIGRAHV